MTLKQTFFYLFIITLRLCWRETYAHLTKKNNFVHDDVTPRPPYDSEGGAEFRTSGWRQRKFESAPLRGRVWTLHRINWKLLLLWKTDPPAWIMDPTDPSTRAAPISPPSPSTSSSVSTLLKSFPTKLAPTNDLLWGYHTPVTGPATSWIRPGCVCDCGFTSVCSIRVKVL